MATKRKTTKKTEADKPALEADKPALETEELTHEQEPVEKSQEIKPHEEPVVKVKEKETKQVKNKHKFNVGDIVFINRKASVDLNGFKLFPQYKKYTYTVEAYDEKSDVYTLRRLNLSLRLKEELILAPNERAHDPINRRQF